MTNPKTDYNDYVRANLPDELSWSEDLGKYQSHTLKRFPQYPEAKRYVDYLPKFQTNALKVFPHPDYCFQDSNGTIRANVGDPVGLLLDRSQGAKPTKPVSEIGGYHLYQEDDDKRPTLQQDSSGKYYLDFDGVDDFLQVNGWSFIQEPHVTMTCAVDSAAGNFSHILEVRGFADLDAQQRQPLFFVKSSTGVIRADYGGTTINSGDNFTGTGVAVTQAGFRDDGALLTHFNGSEFALYYTVPPLQDGGPKDNLIIPTTNPGNQIQMQFYGLSVSSRALTGEEIAKDYREHAIHAGLTQ